MKITKEQLMQIIEEELDEVVYRGDGVLTWKVTLADQVVAATEKQYGGNASTGSQSLIDFLSSIEDVATLEQHSVVMDMSGGRSMFKNGIEAKAYAQEDLDTHPTTTGKRRPKRWNPGYDASDVGRAGFSPYDWYEE
jgi:hypothetical protein